MPRRRGQRNDNYVPDLHESASIDAEGNLNITVCNLSAEDEADIDGILVGFKPSAVKAEILTNKIDAFNDFDAPEVVKSESFDGVKITDEGISFTLPACSVVSITLKP